VLMIDPRAGSKTLIAPLTRRKLPVESCKLDYGDVAFMGNLPKRKVMVGIEYKTITDLLACLQTKRYVGHQLPGMLENYGRVYLLIEGDFRPSPPQRDSAGGILQVRYHGFGGWVSWGAGRGRRWQRPMMFRDLMSFLASMEEAGVRVWQTPNKDATVEYIVSRYTWWSKKWEKHNSLKAIYDGDRIYERDEVLQVRRAGFSRTVAAQLPGIGWKKSSRVIAAMPTMYHMATAAREEWEHVRGIGKTLSKRIYWAIRKPDDKPGKVE